MPKKRHVNALNELRLIHNKYDKIAASLPLLVKDLSHCNSIEAYPAFAEKYALLISAIKQDDHFNESLGQSLTQLDLIDDITINGKDNLIEALASIKDKVIQLPFTCAIKSSSVHKHDHNKLSVIADFFYKNWRSYQTVPEKITLLDNIFTPIKYYLDSFEYQLDHCDSIEAYSAFAAKYALSISAIKQDDNFNELADQSLTRLELIGGITVDGEDSLSEALAKIKDRVIQLPFTCAIKSSSIHKHDHNKLSMIADFFYKNWRSYQTVPEKITLLDNIFTPIKYYLDSFEYQLGLIVSELNTYSVTTNTISKLITVRKNFDNVLNDFLIENNRFSFLSAINDKRLIIDALKGSFDNKYQLIKADMIEHTLITIESRLNQLDPSCPRALPHDELKILNAIEHDYALVSVLRNKAIDARLKLINKKINATKNNLVVTSNPNPRVNTNSEDVMQAKTGEDTNISNNTDLLNTKKPANPEIIDANNQNKANLPVAFDQIKNFATALIANFQHTDVFDFLNSEIEIIKKIECMDENLIAIIDNCEEKNNLFSEIQRGANVKFDVNTDFSVGQKTLFALECIITFLSLRKISIDIDNRVEKDKDDNPVVKEFSSLNAYVEEFQQMRQHFYNIWDGVTEPAQPILFDIEQGFGKKTFSLICQVFNCQLNNIYERLLSKDGLSLSRFKNIIEDYQLTCRLLKELDISDEFEDGLTLLNELIAKRQTKFNLKSFVDFKDQFLTMLRSNDQVLTLKFVNNSAQQQVISQIKANDKNLISAIDLSPWKDQLLTDIEKFFPSKISDPSKAFSTGEKILASLTYMIAYLPSKKIHQNVLASQAQYRPSYTVNDGAKAFEALLIHVNMLNDSIGDYDKQWRTLDKVTQDICCEVHQMIVGNVKEARKQLFNHCLDAIEAALPNAPTQSLKDLPIISLYGDTCRLIRRVHPDFSLENKFASIEKKIDGRLNVAPNTLPSRADAENQRIANVVNVSEDNLPRRREHILRTIERAIGDFEDKRAEYSERIKKFPDNPNHKAAYNAQDTLINAFNRAKDTFIADKNEGRLEKSLRDSIDTASKTISKDRGWGVIYDLIDFLTCRFAMRLFTRPKTGGRKILDNAQNDLDSAFKKSILIR